MKKVIIINILFFISFGLSFGQLAEPKQGESIDKIIAIVGEEIILKSDLDGQMYYMAQMDKTINPTDKEMRKKVLEGLIDQLLLVSKAIKDSVTVSDEEVNQRLELHLQTEIRRFGSEKRIEQVYGMSIPRIKNEIKDKIKNNLLVQSLVSQKFADVKISQKEVEEFYEEYKDSIPNIPPMAEIYHLVKKVEASKDSKEQIFKLASSVRDSILAGGDFADFAKRYSSDYASAKDGGELGWFEKGKLLPEFEQAAAKLAIGEISIPVETPFGFHVIQTLEKKADAIKTRHILFKLGQSQEETNKVLTFLEDIRKKVDAGEPFDSLAKEYSDDKDTKSFGGFLGKVGLSDLPENLRNIIATLNEGKTSEPLLYKNEPSNTSYHIIYKKRMVPEHKPNIKDDNKEIEQMAVEYKKRNLYNDWLQELRKELYWEVIEK